MSIEKQNRYNVKLHDLMISFFRLGVTAFGGPTAHIGYFGEEFVLRRKWLNEETFISIVTLCNLLPGPSSSQVGILIGMMNHGILGAIIAWCSFTLPSAFILMAFANYYSHHTSFSDYNFLHGLKLVAVAVVSQAIVGMTITKIKEIKCIVLIIFSSLVSIIDFKQGNQFYLLLIGATYGMFFLREGIEKLNIKIPININRKIALVSFVSMMFLIISSSAFINFSENTFLKVLSELFIVGGTVFGGGHVVLPMLHQVVVTNGLISNDAFLAGYGLTQAMPGPLFTFSGYLGSMLIEYPYNLIYGILCLISIFLPSFLLLYMTVPLWNNVRNDYILTAIKGIECIVIGILTGALYNPVYLNSVKSFYDNILVLFMFFLLVFMKFPSYIIVVIGIGSGYFMSHL